MGQQIQMLGICRQSQADDAAARELNYRSRALSKCKAIVDRRYIRVLTGDVVALTWPEYGIDGKLFRVANVTRGPLREGKITLSLIEDVFFQHRGALHLGEFPPFPVLVDPGP